MHSQMVQRKELEVGVWSELREGHGMGSDKVKREGEKDEQREEEMY